MSAADPVDDVVEDVEEDPPAAAADLPAAPVSAADALAGLSSYIHSLHAQLASQSSTAGALAAALRASEALNDNYYAMAYNANIENHGYMVVAQRYKVLATEAVQQLSSAPKKKPFLERFHSIPKISVDDLRESMQKHADLPLHDAVCPKGFVPTAQDLRVSHANYALDKPHETHDESLFADTPHHPPPARLPPRKFEIQRGASVAVAGLHQSPWDYIAPPRDGRIERGMKHTELLPAQVRSAFDTLRHEISRKRKAEDGAAANGTARAGLPQSLRPPKAANKSHKNKAATEVLVPQSVPAVSGALMGDASVLPAPAQDSGHEKPPGSPSSSEAWVNEAASCPLSLLRVVKTNGDATAIGVEPSAQIVCLGGKGTLQYFKPEADFEGNPYTQVFPNDNLVRAISISSSSLSLIACGETSRLALVQLTPAGARLTTCIPTGAPNAYGSALAPDNSCVYTTHADGSVLTWDMRSNKRIARFKGHASAAMAIDVSADGTKLITGGYDGHVRVWDIRAPDPISSVDFGRLVSSLTLQPGSSKVAIGLQSGTCEIVDFQRLECKTVLARHTDAVLSARYNDTGSRLFTGSADTTVSIWDCSRNDDAPVCVAHRRDLTPIFAVASARDDRYVITGHHGSFASVFEFRDSST